MEWYSVEEYAELTKTPINTVRFMCRNGRLEAKKFGKEWRIKGEKQKSEVENDIKELNEKMDKLMKLFEEKKVIIV